MPKCEKKKKKNTNTALSVVNLTYGFDLVAANSKFKSYPYCTASSIVGTLKRNPKNQSERTTRDEETINVAIPPLQKSLTEFSFAKNNHAR